MVNSYDRPKPLTFSVLGQEWTNPPKNGRVDTDMGRTVDCEQHAFTPAFWCELISASQVNVTVKGTLWVHFVLERMSIPHLDHVKEHTKLCKSH